jgi:hypothetical protein
MFNTFFRAFLSFDLNLVVKPIVFIFLNNYLYIITNAYFCQYIRLERIVSAI